MSKKWLLSFILNNNHPFTIVEEEHFVRFVKSLGPDFDPGSAASIKNHAIQTFVKNKVELIKEMNGEGVGKISATTDMWTSTIKYAMMAVTFTWIDIDFKMNEAVVAFRELFGSHSGKNIAYSFHTVLPEQASID